MTGLKNLLHIFQCQHQKSEEEFGYDCSIYNSSWIGFPKKKKIGMPSSVPRKDTDTLANGIISNEITHKVIKM